MEATQCRRYYDRTWRLLCASALSVLASPAVAAAQGGPPPVVREAIDVVVRYVSTGDAAALGVLKDRLAAPYRGSFASDGALTRHLEALHTAVGGPVDDISVERDADGLLLRLVGRTAVELRMGLDEATGRITRLELATAAGGGAPGREGPEGAVDAHIEAIMGLAAAPDEVAAFPSARMTPELAGSRTAAEWNALLDRIARAAAGAMGVQVSGDADGYSLVLQGTTTMRIHLQVEDAPRHRLTALSVDTSAVAAPAPAGPPLTWGTLDSRLREMERDGFAGSVLAIRNGEVVLDGGYGMADPAKRIPNTAETIFDIGSIPIDFTRAAIFLLVQEGRLTLDDALSRFFPDAPEDKRAITIRQLLDGRSGLHNFHHVAGDADRDLTWIDRATAERRILSQRLLFAPGTDRSASHSAFGLLAAIVEHVSGTTYEDFLRTRFFEPAGMRRTGPYGDDLGFPPSSFAVGSGGGPAGVANIPPNWGRTSWLVKGSGGMVSTPSDIRRWFDWLRSGRVLRGDALALYLERGTAVGGTDRGFFFVHAWAGGDSMIFLASNAMGRDATRALVQQLTELVRDGVTRP